MDWNPKRDTEGILPTEQPAKDYIYEDDEEALDDEFPTKLHYSGAQPQDGSSSAMSRNNARPIPVNATSSETMFSGISAAPHEHKRGTPKTVNSTGDRESKQSLGTRSFHSVRSINTDGTVMRLEDLRRDRSRRVASEKIALGPTKFKHRVEQSIKCFGGTAFIIFFILFGTYGIVYGFGEEEAPPPDPTDSYYDIQEVLPGRLISLSQNGQVAAIRDDFDFVQIYSYRNSTSDGTSSLLWEPIGSTLRPYGTMNLAANGSLVAFLDDATRRPQVMTYDDSNDSWRKQKSVPIVVGDDLVMSDDATLLAVALYDRVIDVSGLEGSANNSEPRDIVVTYKFDGSDWVQHADRLLINGLISFELSPTGSTLAVTSREEEGSTNYNTTIICGYRLLPESEGMAWVVIIDSELSFENVTPAISMAKDSFAVTSPDSVRFFSYGGRTWGQTLKPANGNFTFAWAALSVNGRTLAVGSISSTNQTGVVNMYTFPYNQDTGDDWQVTGPPLRDEYEWGMEGPSLRDEFGKEIPMFGTKIDLDGDGNTIAVQSGTKRNENVHFYTVNAART